MSAISGSEGDYAVPGRVCIMAARSRTRRRHFEAPSWRRGWFDMVQEGDVVKRKKFLLIGNPERDVLARAV